MVALWRLPPFAARFTTYHVKRGYAEQVIVMAHACMIFGIDLRLQPCWIGTALVRMSNVFYLFWRPTWDTAMSKTRIGIYRVVPNLWDMRRDDWRNIGRRSYERIKLPDTAATLLHSA